MKTQSSFDDGVMPIHIGALLFCIVFIAVGYVLGYAPLMSQTQQETSLIEQAEEAELQAKQIKQELDRIADELSDVKAALDEQPVNLKPASQINPLLAQLADWSELHNLSITRTNAGRPEALAYYDYVPVQISGEGSFGALLAFFDRLNSDRGDLGLVSFKVNRMAAGSGVSFDLELAWYVLSDDVQEQASPQPTALVPTP